MVDIDSGIAAIEKESLEVVLLIVKLDTNSTTIEKLLNLVNEDLNFQERLTQSLIKVPDPPPSSLPLESYADIVIPMWLE